MLAVIETWDGHDLNDSNFEAWFEAGYPHGAGASANYAPRTGTYPLLSSTEIGAGTIVMHIKTKGTIHSQLDTLRAWFNVFDSAKKTLVVSDSSNSNKQWYIKAKPVGDPPVRVSDDGVGEYVVTLAVDEPLWRSVIASTDSLSVTASGDDLVLTVLGNWTARPIITLEITGAKAKGWKYAWWKPLYNPLSVVNEEPFDFTAGGINTTNLLNVTTVSNQINHGGGYNSAALSLVIDTAVGGGLPTGGGMLYVAATGEQIYYTSIAGNTITVYDDGAGTTGRGWGGSTAASIADNAVLTRSLVLKNLNDVRVYNGETEIDCWVGAVGAATQVRIQQRFNPDLTMKLFAAMSTGTVTTVIVQKTGASKAALKRLPQKFMAYIGSELFLCENPKPTAFRFSVIDRAQRGTSAATHVAGSTVRFLENDLTLIYGNPLADAPVRNDDLEPMLDATSTNTSWVHTSFSSEDNLRTAGWKSSITRRRSPTVDGNTRIYTATQNDMADPATELGFAVKAHYTSGVWRAEDMTAAMVLYHPAGFTTATITGNKRRETVDWISFKFQKSLDGITWVNVFTEATPSTAGAWGAISTHSSVSLSGNYPYVRMLANGALRSIAGNANYFEMTSTTMAINSSNVLQVAFATTVDDTYYLDTTMGITETGDEIRLFGTCKNDSVIVIDCDAQTITLDGREGGIGIAWNTDRNEWLEFPSPSQSSTCTLAYTEDGVTGVDVGLEWEDRVIL